MAHGLDGWIQGFFAARARGYPDGTNGQRDRCLAAARSRKLELVSRIARARDRLQVSMSHASHAVKRRYPRVALPKGMLVAWQSTDGKGISRIATLGLGGLFVSTPDPAPVGTLLKLLFDVPGGEVRARATVKNIKPGEGMAVAFIDMGHEDRARLNQLVKRLAD